MMDELRKKLPPLAAASLAGQLPMLQEAARYQTTVEYWRIQCEVLSAYVTDPQVIANAQAAAQWVLDMAPQVAYSLSSVEYLLLDILGVFTSTEHARDAASLSSAQEIADRLAKLAVRHE